MFPQINSFVHAHINPLGIEMFDASLTRMVCNLWDGRIGNVIHTRLWDINNQYNKKCFSLFIEMKDIKWKVYMLVSKINLKTAHKDINLN